jgi:hypothetical protein
MDGSIDIVSVGQMEHLYSCAESTVGAQNNETWHSEEPKNGFVNGPPKGIENVYQC